MDFSAPVGGAKMIELCEAKNQNSTDENALKPSNLKLGIRLAVYVPIMPQATRELAPAKIGQKTKATDLGERMNQHDQMQQTLRLALNALKKVRHVDQQHSEAEQAIEQALAAEPAPTVEPSEDAKRTLANPPERIYLQVGDVDAEFPGEIHWRDVTWCEDQIERTDLLYVRSDLIKP